MEKTKKLWALDIIKDLKNDQLRELVKEMSNISNQDAPAHEKKSLLLKNLFEAEEIEYRTWSDVFGEINFAVKSEIMYRIKIGNF